MNSHLAVVLLGSAMEILVVGLLNQNLLLDKRHEQRLLNGALFFLDLEPDS